MRHSLSTTTARARLAAWTPAQLADAPLVLTIDEVARIYRCMPETIRRGLRAGTFTPRPAFSFPFRWKRSDIEHDLQQRAAADADAPTRKPRRRKARPQ